MCFSISNRFVFGLLSMDGYHFRLQHVTYHPLFPPRPINITPTFGTTRSVLNCMLVSIGTTTLPSTRVLSYLNCNASECGEKKWQVSKGRGVRYDSYLSLNSNNKENCATRFARMFSARNSERDAVDSLQIDTHLKSEMMVSSVYLHLFDLTVNASLRFLVELMVSGDISFRN